MKKILIALLLPVFLSGCLYQTVNMFDLQRAAWACKDKGGIFEVWANFAGDEGVTCVNGTSVALHAVVIGN